MKTLKLIWKNKDLRNKLLIVIAILDRLKLNHVTEEDYGFLTILNYYLHRILH